MLDSLAATSSVAYSLRRVKSAYSGNCIRVRRSSDNTEQNIGFSGNELDTTSLLSFCGAGSGFITTWYDQSGNNRNAVQTSASVQPRIVNAGVLETKNSKPSIRFQAGTIQLESYKFAAPSTAFTANFIASVDNNTGDNQNIIGVDGGGFQVNGLYFENDTSCRVILNRSGGFHLLTQANASASNTLYTFSLTHTAGNFAQMSQNGTLGSSTSVNWTAGNRASFVFGGYPSIGLIGYVSEHIAFSTNLSNTDLSLLNANQGQYYNITVI